VRTWNWLSLKQAHTLLNAPATATTHGLRTRAIIATLHGGAQRRVAALTDGAVRADSRRRRHRRTRHANTSGPAVLVTGRIACTISDVLDGAP